MFSTPMKESLTKKVYKKEWTRTICSTILQYIYTGEVSADQIDLKIYEEVHILEMASFLEKCTDVLIKKLDHETCISTLVLADLHKNKKLKKAAAKFILENSKDDDLLDKVIKHLKDEYEPLVKYLLQMKTE